jgi:hypothetical protein
MKVPRKHRKWLIGGSILLLTATPSFALFGIGDIVFDPTSYANLVSQLTTLESQYKTFTSNITHFSWKQQWQTTLTSLKNANVANMFGETAGINIALNSNSPGASLSGWKSATLATNSNVAPYLASQALGNDRLSQLAVVEMSDAISPDCLTGIGQYRNARSQNASAVSTLSSEEMDGSDDTNSEVEQLNLLNAAEAQKMSEMQAQGTLQTCLAAQMTVANMQQRNAAVEDINTAAVVQKQRTTNDVSAANESNTWQNYIP